MKTDDAFGDLLAAAEKAGLHPFVISSWREDIRLAQVDQELRRTALDSLERVQRMASRAFNSEEQAWWYLRSRQRLLNAVPLDLMLEGEAGVRRVEQALGRMIYGVYT